MEAFVDSREPSSVKNKFTDRFGGRVNNQWTEEERELPQGDFYLPEHDVVIERKEASDFASSTTDGRLSEQADRMIDEHEHCYLVLENKISSRDNAAVTGGYDSLYQLRFSDISDHSIIGMQTSLAVKRGIKIIYTESVEQTLYAVKRIFERHRDGEAGGGDSHVKTHDTGEVDDVQVAMLMQIDGISEEKAVKIAGKRSINSLVPDGEYIYKDEILNDLQSIDGVGDTLAQRVIDAFQ